MKTLLLLLLSGLFFIQNHGICQNPAPCFTQCKTHIIQYNSKGKIISFPSYYINRNDKICFEVLVSGKSILNEVETYRNKIETTLNYFKSENNLNSYYCYFNDSFNIMRYVYQLGLLDNELKEPLYFLKYTDTAVINNIFNNFDNIPIKPFLNNLFY